MKTTLLSIILTLAAAISALGQDSQGVREQHYNLKRGVALQGWDPVSYFSGSPKEGNSAHRVAYQGVTYHFSSAANAAAFKAEPEKYEPQYGGWCAYALAVGNGKVRIDPESYKVVDGKLFLFYNQFPFGNTLNKWNKGSDKAQIAIADAAWQKEKN
ncbi:YHS domain-containing (seleno)protein [Rubritalea marina]|uniref:YHS domain-containing (seleno)protein n=1 Tax=Rubritalea marina TaxID=361055 RepID=UPI00035C33CF|nr:YHS domain-containing (seleno)protein [Rubritalea marina]